MTVDIDAGALAPEAPGSVGRVIVIGAGMSGLVAARALHLAGVETVVVEGRDRIGGRTHTVDVGGVPVDLGGSWIHAGTTSPMLPYVEHLGIERLPAAASTIVSDACIVDRAADLAGEPDAALDRMVALATVMMGVHAADPPPPGSTLAEAVEHLAPDASPAARRGAGLLLAMYEGAEPPEIGFETFVALLLEGGSVADTDVLPSGGYRRVVEALADGLDIRCSTAVEAVRQADGGVTVEASTGPLTGSHVIVTAPLGVLKAGSIGFEPPLPAATTTAIERVGFGVFEKVALEYPSPVWQRDGIPRHLSAIDGVSPEWPTILDMSAWYGAPVVVGLAVGDSARALAAMTEDEKVASLHTVIATIAGPDTPVPTSHAVTSWTNDPFLLGCYTNIALTSTPEQQLADVATLARPHGRVLFAGEHTDEAGTSSVDSAWRSGLREAARLLRRSTVAL